MLLTVGSIAAATALGMPRPVATPSVTIVDSPHIGGGRVRWALEKVLQEAAERTHCRISCLVPHGTVYVPQPTSEADVVVCIWSTPVKTAETKIRSLFGYDFPKTGTSDAFQPVPGLQTCMDENGQAYAQVLPAAAGNPAYVFVLFDLVHTEFDGLTDLMREVFHHVIPAALPPLVAAVEVVRGDASEFFPVLPAPLDLPSAPLEVRQESGRQYRWQHERGAARDAAVVAATDPFEPVIALHVDAVRESRERLAATASAYGATAEHFDTIDRRSGRSHELALLVLSQEYDRICAMPVIEGVEISGTELIAHTRPLTITEDGVIYDIGSWDIHIPRKGIEVRMFRRPRGDTSKWQHPHVDPSGHICWGNVQTELTKSLEDGEYDLAVTWLINLLTTGKGRGADAELHMRILKDIGRPIGRVPGSAS